MQEASDWFLSAEERGDPEIIGSHSAMLGVMKSLWASIQGDPVFMRRVNGWFTGLWIVMIPIPIARGWISSCHVRRGSVPVGPGLRSLVRMAGSQGGGQTAGGSTSS